MFTVGKELITFWFLNVGLIRLYDRFCFTFLYNG